MPAIAFSCNAPKRLYITDLTAYKRAPNKAAILPVRSVVADLKKILKIISINTFSVVKLFNS